MAGKKAGEPKKNGQPAAKPGASEHAVTLDNQQRVEYLAGLGVPHEHIAVLVGLSDDKTLRKHYPAELKMGKAKANAKATQMLFQKVEKGDLGATVFWLKAQAGWREKQTIELSNGNGPDMEEVSGATQRFLGALFTGGKEPQPAVLEGEVVSRG